ncbi:MAG: carboxylesterase [Acidobacteria bacterium]|nr:carboxylesterase [Acidobacteriota bacterium]MYF14746.1 carboxylesterase [Acidobacteriota bacterium]MYI97722.1 carboxylesterase [Acidobacteriota bacterium]
MVEVPPAGRHRATIIWLHGLGADGHDFEPIVPALRLPGSLGVRFLFPEAPFRPVTINGGMEMRAWFDIASVQRDTGVNREHLAESVAGVRSLVELEAERGIPPDRLVLAGFSQGGAVVLQAATCAGSAGEPPLRPAGVVALSTYLPVTESVAPPPEPPTPIFQAHGSFDPLIPVHFAGVSGRALTKVGWTVEYHEYPIAHQVAEAEIRDIGIFLRRVLETSSAAADLSA